MLVVQEYDGIAAANPRMDESKNAEMVAFLLYAARREGDDLGKLPNASFRTVRFLPAFLLSRIAFSNLPLNFWKQYSPFR